ncbi:alpha/beta hydrolase [Demequina sp. NBRC 110053]|uniref:RBBP9/YdeN family alpha/beta hydrolase n=1 Tax=Demequina sp. NBRC 110053 TaxID=1570342 RepID=UPI000A029275|nr:alpha/beta fold hydrolase [Demequina sp. NBRC 110053]
MTRMSAPFGPTTLARRLVIVPGLGGSGPSHWQTLWQQAHPRATTFAPASVDAPELEDWIHAVDRGVDLSGDRPVLVAHSLGTIAAAAWMARRPQRAMAALLVAPPDTERADAPEAIRGFVHVPTQAAGVPVAVVASRDDPYGTFAHAERVAQALGARLVDAGSRGHLNADSGLGAWEVGLLELDRLAAAASPSVVLGAEDDLIPARD